MDWIDEEMGKLTLKVRDIMYNGEPHKWCLSEDRFYRILEFKGTGEKRKFMDIATELEILGIDAISDGLKNRTKIKVYPWLDDYIIDNNFQIEFEKDDVIYNKSKI